MVNITKADLEPTLFKHQGNMWLQKCLQKIHVNNVEPVVGFMIGYVGFNSAFGPGVANLAAELANRHDLFVDMNEPNKMCRDRSMEIGAAVFAAAIDEFGDTGFKKTGFIYSQNISPSNAQRGYGILQTPRADNN
jgi:hypothetical protein